MAKYTKSVMLDGSWAKAADLKTGMTAQIVSETNPMPSQFKNKDGSIKNQDVCKIKFDGFNETFNLALNRATINGLVDAFGEDSANWQNKVLSVETEKMRVSGKSVVALYLIPAGYQKIDDKKGYAMIVEADVKPDVDPRNCDDQTGGHVEQEDDPRAKDLPF